MIFSTGAILLGLTIREAPKTIDRWIVKEIFTTFEGRWYISDTPYSVPNWAINNYLLSTNDLEYFDDAGGNHHIFCLSIYDSKKMANAYITTTDDGKLEVVSAKIKSKWANKPIYNSITPGIHNSGWNVAINGEACDIVQGVGLPNNQHVSTFIVWEFTKADDTILIDPNPNNSDSDILRRLSVVESNIVAIETYLKSYRGA